MIWTFVTWLRLHLLGSPQYSYSHPPFPFHTILWEGSNNAQPTLTVWKVTQPVLFRILLQGDLFLFPHLLTYSIILYQYELIDVYFILWLIIYRV